jgi:hypothetical protein
MARVALSYRTKLPGRSRCSDEVIDGDDLGHGWNGFRRLKSLNQQQKHFADLQEFCVVDVPVFDHPRLRFPAFV